MKPERSPQRTTFLPKASPANFSTLATASGAVTMVSITSTSGSTGTGLKKWSPSTRLGFFVAAAIFMIGMLEVFEARTASGSVTTLSRSAKSLALTASFSTISLYQTNILLNALRNSLR